MAGIWTFLFKVRWVKRTRFHRLIRRVRQVFKQMDRAVGNFQRATLLGCETGCGQCCTSPRVETTPLEMYPLARYLIKRCAVDTWYDKAADSGFEGPCVFYQPDAFNPQKGRCGVYALRPGICRLYGFSAVTDKQGEAQLMTCAVIKNKQGNRLTHIQASIRRGLKIPVMKMFASRIYRIDPLDGCVPMPINKAFKAAVDKLSLAYQYRSRLKKKNYSKGGDDHGRNSGKTKPKGAAATTAPGSKTTSPPKAAKP